MVISVQYGPSTEETCRYWAVQQRFTEITTGQWSQRELQEIPSNHKFFSVSPCTGFPDSCGVPSLEIFKTQLDVSMGSLPWVALLEQGLEQMYPEVTSNFNHSNSVVYVDFFFRLSINGIKWDQICVKTKLESVLVLVTIIHYQVNDSVFCRCFFGLFCIFRLYSDDFFFFL